MTTLTAPSSTSTEALPIRWIESLFNKMLLDYGRKFTDQWAGPDPVKLKQHWANELAGYTNAELKRGHDALAGRDWPPTLPEFKRMCRPAVDSVAAYYEAVAGVNARDRGEMGQWSHPAIFWASVRMAFDLKGLTFSAVKDRWEAALHAELDKGQWADIPQPALALPAPGKAFISREDALKRLAELNASAVVKKNRDGNDQRAWIGKILERAKRKDPTLPGISLRFAKEALEAKP
jgi:hypothetical protein